MARTTRAAAGSRAAPSATAPRTTRGGRATGGAPVAMPRVPEPPEPSERPASLEGASAAEVLGGYLHAQAAEFLRSLRLRGEHEGSPAGAAAAACAVSQLRRSARRLGGSLHTYRHLLDPAWADQLRGELSWLSGTLAREYACAARLERLLGALRRLTSETGGAGSAGVTGGAVEGVALPGGGDGGGGEAGCEGTARDSPLAAGAARACALLERQLTLARTRAHTTALQALVSGRFHAVADEVALLASEAPLLPEAAGSPAAPTLLPLAEGARRRLAEAVAGLPLPRGVPDLADGPARSLTAAVRQDAAWRQVRVLLRLHRYAEEVLALGAGGEVPAVEEHGADAGEAAGPAPQADAEAGRLASASATLDWHREAAEAADAAEAAARTPRIAPSTAYALGILHADQRQEVAAARYGFGQLWRARPGGQPVNR
jgi:hypothetical protein